MSMSRSVCVFFFLEGGLLMHSCSTILLFPSYDYHSSKKDTHTWSARQAILFIFILFLSSFLSLRLSSMCERPISQCI